MADAVRPWILPMAQSSLDIVKSTPAKMHATGNHPASLESCVQTYNLNLLFPTKTKAKRAQITTVYIYFPVVLLDALGVNLFKTQFFSYEPSEVSLQAARFLVSDKDVFVHAFISSECLKE